MARLTRQYEALLSGYVKRAVPFPQVQNTWQQERLAVPGVGAPLSGTGTLRHAPSPELILWAGIRTTDNYNGLVSGDVIHLQIELGIIPYNPAVPAPGPTPRNLQPGWAPFSETWPTDGSPIVNVLTQRTRCPWPVGALQLRFTYEYMGGGPPPIGPEVDIFCAWAAVSNPAYSSLPLADSDTEERFP
jgi:hypothetical protein